MDTSSLFLRPSANTALEQLRTIEKNLTTTQDRVSTGYRIQGAKDNGAYWAVATMTRSDSKAVAAVSDALGLAAATMDVSYTAVDNTIDVVTQIKAKLVAATEKGVDKDKLNEELTQLKAQLRTSTQAANFNKDNWVVVDSGDDPTKPKQIPSSIIRGSNGSIAIGMLTYHVDVAPSGTVTSDDARYVIDDRADGSGEYGVLTSTYFATEVGAAQNYVLVKSANGDTTGQTEIALNSETSDGDVADMLKVVDGMLGQLTTVGSAFGALSDRIKMQSDFAASLGDALESGVSRLVDADMEEESTKLKALQTQEQLGLQALQITNSSYDTVRQLFQNF